MKRFLVRSLLLLSVVGVGALAAVAAGVTTGDSSAQANDSARAQANGKAKASAKNRRGRWLRCAARRRKRGRIVVACPRRAIRGPRGPRGRRGPVGAAGATGQRGPQGPAGGASAFKFLATSNTPNTTIMSVTGAVVEASCGSDQKLANAHIRATADHGMARVSGIHSDIAEITADNNFSTGNVIDLKTSSSIHGGNYELNYAAPGGSPILHAAYQVNDPSPLGNTFDCAILGVYWVAG